MSFQCPQKPLRRIALRVVRAMRRRLDLPAQQRQHPLQLLHGLLLQLRRVPQHRLEEGPVTLTGALQGRGHLGRTPSQHGQRGFGGSDLRGEGRGLLLQRGLVGAELTQQGGGGAVGGSLCGRWSLYSHRGMTVAAPTWARVCMTCKNHSAGVMRSATPVTGGCSSAICFSRACTSLPLLVMCSLGDGCGYDTRADVQNPPCVVGGSFHGALQCLDLCIGSF